MRDDRIRELQQKPFDFIVIGAGSAGCTLTARLLRDDPTATVLLVEAGGTNDRAKIRDPAGSFELTAPGSDVDWGYKSTPQKQLNNRRQSYSAGKVLGGSSSINGMVWVRGNRSDYDGWAGHGAPGWDYASVRPNFMNLETYLGGNVLFHGTRGPIHPTAELTEESGLARAALSAAVRMGFHQNLDYNGEFQHGVAFAELNIHDGRRQDAYSAFVKPLLPHPRLTVLTRALVTEMVLTRERKVKRVLIDHRGLQLAVEPKREVVICAGAVNSPVLLMRSGIGDPKELQNHNIRPVVPLMGVGKNLQDHVVSVVVKRLRAPINTQHLTDMGILIFAKGLPGDGIHNPDEGAPRFQVQSYHLKRAWGNVYPAASLALGVNNLQPKSRGTVTLASADVRQAPIIDPNLLSVREGRLNQLEGFKMVRKIINSPPLDEWLIEAEHTPGAGVDTDEELLEVLRHHSYANFHPVGTCKMGQDSLAVVDPRLRVYGVDGLRVAGAPIMPLIPSGNTNAGSMMIGDKCGELIVRRRRS